MRRILNLIYKLFGSKQDSTGDDRNTSGGTVDDQLKKAQESWLSHMEALKNHLGVVMLPENAPELTALHLKNCRLLPNREAVLHQMKKGGIAAEVGVQEGHFSSKILQICQPQKLHLIDVALTYFGVAQKFESEIKTGQVVLHERDSAVAISSFPDAYFDLIYIDADHSYPGVKRDIEAAKAKVKEDGFLVFNDYTYWSPVECINYGVIQAVNELCLHENWEMIYFALAGYMYCDVALRRLYSSQSI